MKKFSIGRMVAGVVLGLLSGILLPLTLALSQFAMITPIAISALWAFSGPAGAMSATIASLGMAGLLGGWGATWPALVALVVPGWGFIALLEKRMRFFEGMRFAVAAELALLFAAVALIWLYVRTDLISAFTQELKQVMAALPGLLTDQMLLLMGRMGIFGNVANIDFTAAALTAGEREKLGSLYLEMVSAGFRLMLPSMLLNGGVVTALIGYVLPLRICQRRGDEPMVSLAPLREWRLTTGLIVGPALCALICQIAYASGMRGADSVYYAMFNLAQLLFVIQGMGAVERKMHQSGVSRGRRMAAQLVLLLLGYRLLLPLVGLLSALFGSQGLISGFFRKRTKDNDKEDDEP